MLTDTLKVKNKTVEIHQEDDFSESPREWDNLGTMVCFHPDYNLGDKDHIFGSPEDFVDFLENDKYIALPLLLLDHSGLWMKTIRFECDYGGWDTSHVGYIYVTHEQLRYEYGWKYLTKDRIAKIKSYLQAEVEIYSMYLEGRTYFFHSTCDSCGEEDSCGGFYGEDWKDNGLMEHVDYYCSCKDRPAANNKAVIQGL